MDYYYPADITLLARLVIIDHHNLPLPVEFVDSAIRIPSSSISRGLFRVIC